MHQAVADAAPIEPVVAPIWLTIAQAVAHSALSKRTINAMLAAGTLTRYKPVPGRTLINKVELDRVLLASAQAPRESA